MAVFTTFPEAALARYLAMFGLGELAGYTAIESGIENSNYFVTLRQEEHTAEFVLTIAEDLDFPEVPFFNELFRNLDRAGLPVPNPQQTLHGMTDTIFCGKPAWLFPRLPGSHPDNIDQRHCEQVGVMLASIHEAAARSRYHRANPYSSSWARHTLEQFRHQLSAGEADLLEQSIREYENLDQASLPTGIIHGDLFQDNTLFTNGELTGVIDFYHACDDYLVQDIAITVNAWAVNDNGTLIDELANALINGYQLVRTLSAEEAELIPAFRRAAAMRFALTRLLSGGSSGEYKKDPQEFLQILSAEKQETAG